MASTVIVLVSGMIVGLGAVGIVVALNPQLKHPSLPHVVLLLLGMSAYALGHVLPIIDIRNAYPVVYLGLVTAIVTSPVHLLQVILSASTRSMKPAVATGLYTIAITTGLLAVSMTGPVRAAAMAVFYGFSLSIVATAAWTVLLERDRLTMASASVRARHGLIALLVLVLAYFVIDLVYASWVRASEAMDWSIGARLGLLAIVAIAAIGGFSRWSFTLALSHRRRKPTNAAEPDHVAAQRLAEVMATQRLWQIESLTLADVADATSIPAYRLRRIMTQHLRARNFRQFLNTYRIEFAKQRLRQTDDGKLSVTDVAFEAGFNSLSTFNRAFKEQVGQTPNAWRESDAGISRRQIKPVKI